MFHVILVLMPLILFVLLAIVASLILFGIVTVVLSLIGGAAAMTIKNRTVKYLLLVSFLILFLIGVQCLFPFVGAYFSMEVGLFPLISMSLFGLIVLLSVGGIKLSTTIPNKTGRTLLIVLFSLFGAAALALALFVFSLR
ncbi:hypothetical protein [Candidatus Enterococcus ferrettii]|uniref:Uncharacterized protein n=1 Tax=Candidatus Enterococcus ferrettii TaxID=2815324 RepID=A0ABV0EK23_9ENTE|nr:hypothetical protein [Enterococcus sp. 665A]MBO1338292.1 hypothetical protein [Enterococcus sp. 665A]